MFTLLVLTCPACEGKLDPILPKKRGAWRHFQVWNRKCRNKACRRPVQITTTFPNPYSGLTITVEMREY